MKTLTAKDAKYECGRLIRLARAVSGVIAQPPSMSGRNKKARD